MPNSNFFAHCFSLIRGWYTLGNKIMNSFYRLAQTIVAIKINKIKQYLMYIFKKKNNYSTRACWIWDVKSQLNATRLFYYYTFPRIQCELMGVITFGIDPYV